MIPLTINIKDTPEKLIPKSPYRYVVGATKSSICDTSNPEKLIETKAIYSSLEFDAKIYLPLVVDPRQYIIEQRERRFGEYEGFVEEILFPNYVYQHIPNFMEGFKKSYDTFVNTEELLDIDWIKRWSHRPNFYRYSISSSTIYKIGIQIVGYQHHLMVEEDKGYKWWVIGYLQNVENVNLPKWKPLYKNEKAAP